MSPRPNFDRIARAYRWLEYCSFGRALECCRFAQLPHLDRAQSVLVLGDGDGRFLARLLAVNPAVDATVVDISEAMLTLARERTHTGASVTFIHADIREYSPALGHAYDLVVTHFFLDCLAEEDIALLIQRILPSLTPDCSWVVSEFAVPARGLAKPVARLLIRSLYMAFRIVTGLRIQRLPDYAAVLKRAGFACEDAEVFLHGILRSERWKRLP